MAVETISQPPWVPACAGNTDLLALNDDRLPNEAKD